MKIFTEAVVKDAIIYLTHCNRKTVTTMYVIYALKCHRHTLHGFTCPYSYSRKIDQSFKSDSKSSDPYPKSKAKV